MKIVRLAEVEPVSETRSLFTGGTVTRQTIVTSEMGENFRSAVVNFGPGARTKFHRHTCDQILIVTAGRGIVATDKEEKAAGINDIIFFPAGEKHWHGATKDSNFSHITIQPWESQTTQLEE